MDMSLMSRTAVLRGPLLSAQFERWYTCAGFFTSFVCGSHQLKNIQLSGERLLWVLMGPVTLPQLHNENSQV